MRGSPTTDGPLLGRRRRCCSAAAGAGEPGLHGGNTAVVRDDAYRAPAHAAVVWVLASVSNRTEVGDVTSLANPEIVEQIRGMVQADRPGDP